MRFQYHTLDVFTDQLFGGNPLAVFPDARDVPDADLQRIARELNLSETVFVRPPETEGGTRRVRIFTPGAEVPFAGHPTVGTAFFLVAAGEVEVTGETVTVVLEENVGPVPVEVTLAGGRPIRARLTAAVPHAETPTGLAPSELARLIGVAPDDLGAELPGLSRPLEPVLASAGLPFLVVPVRDVAVAERASLDAAAWQALLPEGSLTRMVYVVAAGAVGAGVDLHVRMFAPSVGVPEDPATGSAAAALGGALGQRATRDGTHVWTAEQGLEMGRPSLLEIEATVTDGAVTTVKVGGGAVLVAHAEMEIPT